MLGVLPGEGLQIHGLAAPLPTEELLGEALQWIAMVVGKHAAPRLLIGGHRLPINEDEYFVRTLRHPELTSLTGYSGVMDANGLATAGFGVVPGQWSITGVTAHHVFVLYGASLMDVRSVSNAVPVTILP